VEIYALAVNRHKPLEHSSGTLLVGSEYMRLPFRHRWLGRWQLLLFAKTFTQAILTFTVPLALVAEIADRTNFLLMPHAAYKSDYPYQALSCEYKSCIPVVRKSGNGYVASQTLRIPCSSGPLAPLGSISDTVDLLALHAHSSALVDGDPLGLSTPQ